VPLQHQTALEELFMTTLKEGITNCDGTVWELAVGQGFWTDMYLVGTSPGLFSLCFVGGLVFMAGFFFFYIFFGALFATTFAPVWECFVLMTVAACANVLLGSFLRESVPDWFFHGSLVLFVPISVAMVFFLEVAKHEAREVRKGQPRLDKNGILVDKYGKVVHRKLGDAGVTEGKKGQLVINGIPLGKDGRLIKGGANKDDHGGGGNLDGSPMLSDDEGEVGDDGGDSNAGCSDDGNDSADDDDAVLLDDLDSSGDELFLDLDDSGDDSPLSSSVTEKKKKKRKKRKKAAGAVKDVGLGKVLHGMSVAAAASSAAAATSLLESPPFDFAGAVFPRIPSDNSMQERLDQWIAKGARLNRKQAVRTDLLLQAAAAGHEEATKVLLRTPGVRILKEGTIPGKEAGERFQGLAIHFAAYGGHAGVIKLLLAKPCDTNSGRHIDRPSLTGMTALYIAARIGRLKAVKILIQAGADMELEHCDTSILGILEGGTPLLAAATHGHVQVVEYLLNAGANKAAVHADRCALFLAATHGHVAVLKALIQAKANLDRTAENGNTPLGVTVQLGHEKATKLLLDAGADKSKIKHGGAPLIVVAANEGVICHMSYNIPNPFICFEEKMKRNSEL
jgi:ankyrin repeat protein